MNFPPTEMTKTLSPNACLIPFTYKIFLVFLCFLFLFFTEDNEQREHLLNVLKQKAEQNAQYKTSSVNGKDFIHKFNR